MNEKKTKYSLGIMAYGSLIDEPGDELDKYIIGKMPCITPFRVEYARESSTRGSGPTLIPFDNGGYVSASILVLESSLTLGEAKNMLWRRETRTKDRNKIYRHANNPTNNTVIVNTIDNWKEFDHVLYTSIGCNIEGELTAKKLSELAIASIHSAAGREKKDGIRYLSKAIDLGIETPLTNEYATQILQEVGGHTLADVISILDNKRIIDFFGKYTSCGEIDHLSVALALKSEPDFEKKIKLYADIYGLLGARGRIFTKNANGDEDEKIFCSCTICRKENERYEEENTVYEEYLKDEFEELRNLVNSTLEYGLKIRIWDAIFDGFSSEGYRFVGEEYQLELQPGNEVEKETQNRFMYEKILNYWYKKMSALPKYFGKDFESRKAAFLERTKNALYLADFREKVVASIRMNVENLRDARSIWFFDRMVEGEIFTLSEEVLDYRTMFSFVAATEEYKFLKFVETFTDQGKYVTSRQKATGTSMDILNEFYDIASEGSDPVGYQLRNLGKEKEIARIAPRRSRHDYDGGSEPSSRIYYGEVNAEDYDGLFASELYNIKPVYQLEELLDYHHRYYVDFCKRDSRVFQKHIRYVVLPLLEKYYAGGPHKQLIEEWLDRKGNNMNKETSPINIHVGSNSTAQIQVQSTGNQQQQVGLDASTVIQFFELLTKEIEHRTDQPAQDLRYEMKAAKRELEAGRPIGSRLHAIIQLVKDLGLNVAANIFAAPIYEAIKPHLGL